MTRAELSRIRKTIRNLSQGASSYQKKYLPALSCVNDESSYENGEVLSDSIADWVVGEFVAGPFKYPPVKDFRTNPLKVIIQHGKARMVVNASAPVGRSFNDNVDVRLLEKIEMSSACRFGQSVLRAGRNSVMSKFDMVSAYKNVPCMIKDLRLQGFEFGGRYFVETTQMFGAKTAVANYDTLGNSVLSLAKCVCRIPKDLVHRQLDDVPVVGPAHTNWCQEFTKEYEEVCKYIGVKLAPDCPNKDKAFKNSTEGKVLGISFNTENLSWNLPEDKRIEYMNTIHSCLMANEAGVKDCQELLGKLNFVCTMIPFMRTFKKPLQEFLRILEESEMTSAPVPEEVQKDLKTWWKFLDELGNGLPIPDVSENPPLHHITLTTDAAGWSKDSDETMRVGMGGVGLNEEGEIFMVCQNMWDMGKVGSFLDKDGKNLGSKTTSLEFTGILIPFLLYPEELRNKHVVVQVDNLGCYYAWENGYAKEDDTASILVRTLVLVAAKLSCVVYLVHLPRESSWESRLADRLSREKTTKSAESDLLKGFEKRKIPRSFKEWMRHPTEDWQLPIRVVSEI